MKVFKHAFKIQLNYKHFIPSDLDELQLAISNQMKSKKMTSEEICAVCLGLKKISNFKINNKFLRLSLYHELCHFQARDDPLDDFFVMTLMTTLSKGNLLFLDDVNLVSGMLQSMQQQVECTRNNRKQKKFDL